MPMTLHNYNCEGERFVPVEPQPHHIDGVLSKIQETKKNSDCELKDIYST